MTRWPRCPPSHPTSLCEHGRTAALRGDDRLRRHPALATAYGAGLALIVDEFALLLDLEDVYWAKQGRVSVDQAIGLSSATGSMLAGLPVLRRLRARRRP